MKLVKNSKLLIVLLSALLVSLSGCDVDKAKPVTVSDKTDDLRVYIIDGAELECVSWVHQLSCNWSKYNELKIAN